MWPFALSSADSLEHQRYNSSVYDFVDILRFRRPAREAKQPGELDHGSLLDDLEDENCRDAGSIEDVISAA